jgi:hypothetical protein
MALTSDEHVIEIDGISISVMGSTGPVHATWTLLVDGHEQDSAKAVGDFGLCGTLPDGSQVRAEVHQSLVGPTEVIVFYAGEEIHRSQGFVA